MLARLRRRGADQMQGPGAGNHQSCPNACNECHIKGGLEAQPPVSPLFKRLGQSPGLRLTTDSLKLIRQRAAYAAAAGRGAAGGLAPFVAGMTTLSRCRRFRSD
jgi:hypothetical protein